jgi:hypothetical protein
VAEADWILMFDADEFLCINYGDGTLDPMLDAAGDANGIVITWRIFGSGNVVGWSRDPVSEQYLYAAPPTWNKGWGVKTLFKFDPDKWKIGIHRPSIKNKHLETGFPDTVKWLNGSGLPMEDYFKFRGWRSIRRTVGYQWAQMNHYAVKSIDSYAIRKQRGNVNNKKDKYNADYWSLQDRNEVYDDKILRYTERRNQIMDELLTDPVLARLHWAAIDRVEARLDEYRKTDAYAELKTSLIEASKVPITQIVAKPPKARNPAEIAALMSQVEKSNASRPAEERRKKPEAGFADVGEGGDGFVPGEIDVSAETAVEWIDNHEIALPADVRIFAQNTLDLVIRGKYQRRPARRIGRMVEDGQKLLDLGAGIGFLSIFTAKHMPLGTVIAQEDNASRMRIMHDILTYNDLALGDRLHMTTDQVVFPDDAKTVARINQMIADEKPDVLRASYEQIGAKLLSAVTLGSVKRVILIGPAIGTFLREHDQIDNPALTPSEELSTPEFIILLPTTTTQDQS